MKPYGVESSMPVLTRPTGRFIIFYMKKAEQTKERLLEQAIKLMQQKGFGAMSISELLLAAGVKKGTLYYHFPGKDDLGMAVLTRVRCDFFAKMDDILSNASPLAGLELFFDSVLERHRAKGFVGGCLFGNTALEMSDSDSSYNEFVRQVFAEWTDKMQLAIQRGQKAGEIVDGITSAELAQTVVATIEGGIMMSRLTKAEGPLRTCLESLKSFLRKA